MSDDRVRHVDPEGGSPDFFVSYSHNDLLWAEWIAWQLEAAGYRVIIQAWDFGPGTHFVDKMDRAMTTAARTLIVLSKGYAASAYTRAEWAAAFARDPTAVNKALLPVRVDDFVPAGLLGQIVWTDLVGCDETTAAHRLLAAASGSRLKPIAKPIFPAGGDSHLLDKPHFPRGHVLPSIGLSGLTKDDNDSESRRFSDSIRAHTLRLQRRVDKLTDEQVRVLDQLRFLKRVRIAGLPGSGKTLVAAEKAIRVARAGMRTVFVCHNPRLADYVSHLTQGTNVSVVAFTQWVSSMALSDTAMPTLWSNYDEPTADLLEQAFDRLTTAENRYDAVIVDEGQDFREEWWAIVEASLEDARTGLLYIFHDDRQALLPHRSQYPFRDPIIDLSRNCRNGGRIYDIMRCLCSGAPECEPSLRGLGDIFFEVVRPGFEKEAVQRALAWFPFDELSRLTVLFSGSAALAESVLHPLPIPLEGTSSWREEVRRLFRRACAGRTIGNPPLSPAAVDRQLQALSFGREPSATDIELVQSVARQFTIAPEARRRVQVSDVHRDGLEWRVVLGRLRLKHRTGHATLWISEIVMHFERADWSLGIPREAAPSVRVASSDVLSRGVVPCRVSDFKGLESSSILLYIHDLGTMPNEEFLVAISRARSFLAIVIQNHAAADLPGSVRRALTESQARSV